MRYQRIHTAIWDDEDYQELTDQEQHFYFWLMTNRYNNIAGIYKLSDAVIRDEYRCGKSKKRHRRNRIKALMGSVLAPKLAIRCPQMQLIAIRGQYKHNPLFNKNQVTSAVRIIQNLPKSMIYQQMNIQPLTEPYHEPLKEILLNRCAIPVPLSLSLTSPGKIPDNSHVDNSEKSDIKKPMNEQLKRTIFLKIELLKKKNFAAERIAEELIQAKATPGDLNNVLAAVIKYSPDKPIRYALRILDEIKQQRSAQASSEQSEADKEDIPSLEELAEKFKGEIDDEQ